MDYSKSLETYLPAKAILSGLGPVALHKSLCDGDSAEFFDVAQDVLASSDHDVHRAAVSVLEKLWKKDRSLGDGLP
jgi:hypothetical protein